MLYDMSLLLKVLQCNSSLRKLVLDLPDITAEGTSFLRRALGPNTTLTTLELGYSTGAEQAQSELGPILMKNSHSQQLVFQVTRSRTEAQPQAASVQLLLAQCVSGCPPLMNAKPYT